MDNAGRRITTSLAIGIGVLGLLALLALAGLLVVYTGAYNIAASEEHMSFTRWAFDTTMHRSVERRAPGDEQFAEVAPAVLAHGASEYRAMCQHCHAGPGVEREAWADGMRPRPPHLVEAASEWERREVFWLVKHGVKMSGMPAFGGTHDDAALWDIAAFVKQLPAMSAERYAALTAGAHGGSGHGAAGHHAAPQQGGVDAPRR